ncbi:uncharacterized protein LOC119161199 isoform X2 [Rhipicephalus microplus]|uniref:uncharacterized protein LOC119161199 isoform X2 n=1 Tax=Rhipicephalus microplus TaxID=6941 RepID=UPI003F6CDF59
MYFVSESCPNKDHCINALVLPGQRVRPGLPTGHWRQPTGSVNASNAAPYLLPSTPDRFSTGIQVQRSVQLHRRDYKYCLRPTRT